MDHACRSEAQYWWLSLGTTRPNTPCCGWVATRQASLAQHDRTDDTALSITTTSVCYPKLHSHLEVTMGVDLIKETKETLHWPKARLAKKACCVWGKSTWAEGYAWKTKHACMTCGDKVAAWGAKVEARCTTWEACMVCGTRWLVQRAKERKILFPRGTPLDSVSNSIFGQPSLLISD